MRVLEKFEANNENLHEKIALVTGNFNVLHPGHIRLLKFAKNCAKKLIVGVFSDEIAGNAADVPQNLRLEAVEAINLVDRVFLINEPLEEFIETHRPAIIVKGKEYEGRQNPELEVLKTYGGELIFSSGEMSLSNLTGEDKTHSLTDTVKGKIHSFMSRHNVSQQRLSEIVTCFADKKICVLGDTIVDEYVDCFPLGMSQEEPTLVVNEQETKQFLGGAGIVASHAAQLGARVKFISVAGQDKARDFAASSLEKYGVNYSFVVDLARPTTVKKRYRSHGRSLLRVSRLSQRAISNQLQKLLFSEFEKDSSEFDLVVFSDFNYGCLPQPLIEKIISLAKDNNILTAADSQSSSQVGNISRFWGVDLITPTEREARLAMQNHDDGLVVLADNLLSKTGSQNIILKLAAEGMIAQIANKDHRLPHTDRLEALNLRPVDVSGAGDSVLITASLALSCGANLWEASLLGSIAAFVQVGRIGNIPLTKNELLSVIQ
jgi:rfaE bifunctional protein kinase chain/domain